MFIGLKRFVFRTKMFPVLKLHILILDNPLYQRTFVKQQITAAEESYT